MTFCCSKVLTYMVGVQDLALRLPLKPCMTRILQVLTDIVYKKEKVQTKFRGNEFYQVGETVQYLASSNAVTDDLQRSNEDDMVAVVVDEPIGLLASE